MTDRARARAFKQVTVYDVIESPGKAWAHVRSNSTTPFPKFHPCVYICPFLTRSFTTWLPAPFGGKKKKKKVLLHGEFQDGKTLDVESIYQFTLVEELASGGNSPKIGAIADFVDSAAFAGIGGGE